MFIRTRSKKHHICNLFIILNPIFRSRMAETQKKELDLEEFGIKEEIVSIKEEILPSSTVEDTCSVDTDLKGKLENN